MIFLIVLMGALGFIIIAMSGIVGKNQVLIQIGDEQSLNWRTLEQILVSVTASGFLGVSITIVASFKGTIVFSFIWFILTSWILFATSLILIMISYGFSDWESRVRRKKIEAKPDQFPLEEWEEVVKTNWRCNAIDFCNWGALLSVIVGVILVAIFSIINFK